MNISVSGARSKEEVKDLKRKLVNELDHVRKMASKLEEKEIQLTEYSSIGAETIVPVRHLEFPVNGGIEKGMGGGLRMISETGSVGFNGSRPFRQLSVSVMNNNHHGIIRFFPIHQSQVFYVHHTSHLNQCILLLYQ